MQFLQVSLAHLYQNAKKMVRIKKNNVMVQLVTVGVSIKVVKKSMVQRKVQELARFDVVVSDF